MNMTETEIKAAASESLAALEAGDAERARSLLTTALRTEAPAEAEAPARVVIRSRYRDLNSKGRGEEVFRLVLDEASGRLVWADQYSAAVVVSDGWCRRGYRAAERRCDTRVELPTGLIIVEVTKHVGNGSRPSYAAGVVTTTESGKGKINWNSHVKHVGVRKDGDSYVHILDIDGERREVRS